jgi:hypothetical protein
MQQSQTIGSLVGSLAKAQEEIKNPPLDSVNPHFKNRYASLGAHLDAVRIPFAKQGLVLTQLVESEDNRVSVTTMIAHSSGEWISSMVSMPLPDRATAQNLGAIVTYLRRYAIGSIALLTGEEDTDAEQDRVARQQVQDKPKPAPKPEPRVAAEAKPPTPRDVFDATPVDKKAAPAAGAAKRKEWPRSGIDAVRPTKVIDRDEHRSAMLCEHGDAAFGSQWIAIPVSMVASVKMDKAIELTWTWNEVGMFREAVEIRPLPKLRELIGQEVKP